MPEVTEKILRRRRQIIIGMLCTAEPPLNWCDDSDEGHEFLQEWVCRTLRSEINHATGMSIIDAAWGIAASQIEKGMETFKKE